MISIKSRPLILLLLIITACWHNTFAVNVIVTDGDSLKIDSQKIRLFGIDAPELKQQCYHFNNEAWD